jgi:hypothetical protein
LPVAGAPGAAGARKGGALGPRSRASREGPSPALSERESEQARAKQHEAGCRQSEKTVGYQVMSTHVTPATLQARPNSLKLSESAFSKEVVLAQGQALERKPSNAWARKIPALNRPKNAVTVSIIATSFAPRHPNTTPCHCAQSKGFRGGIEDPAGVMLWHNSLAGEGSRARPATDHAPQPLIHHAGALPISAVFGMRYLHILMRRWAASRHVTGMRCQVGARPAEW